MKEAKAFANSGNSLWVNQSATYKIIMDNLSACYLKKAEMPIKT